MKSESSGECNSAWSLKLTRLFNKSSRNCRQRITPKIIFSLGHQNITCTVFVRILSFLIWYLCITYSRHSFLPCFSFFSVWPFVALQFNVSFDIRKFKLYLGKSNSINTDNKHWSVLWISVLTMKRVNALNSRSTCLNNNYQKDSGHFVM